MREGDDFDTAFKHFISVLDTDMEYVKNHARLLVRAHEWEQKSRNDSFLLRGAELEEAEAWLSEASTFKEPRPTGLHLEYIQTSQRVEEANQRANQILTKAARKARQRILLGSVILLVTLGISAVSSLIAYRSVVQATQAREAAQEARSAAVAADSQRMQQEQAAQQEINALQQRITELLKKAEQQRTGSGGTSSRGGAER
jgi:hypothetical protein